MTTEADARRIAASIFGEPASSCERFPTGLSHWVYDVVLDSGASIVVRLSHPDNRDELAGGVFWHNQLTSVGVPVAEVLASDIEAVQPYMVLERLPGTDLGNVFDQLEDAQLRGIADAVGDMQDRAGSLPPTTGFGYAHNFESKLEPTWRRVLDASIDRSGERISAIGIVDPQSTDKVRQRLSLSAPLLKDIEPAAFLHDATTKNVIVANGMVTGLVDVDQMAFGDQLCTAALTRMSLLSAKRPTDYVDYLLPNEVNRERLDLYTAIFCLGFLAELGQSFNQTMPAPIDPAHLDHLETTLGSLLDRS